MFQIDVSDLHWIQNVADDPEDLCLHGTATAVIGTETLTYDATVSATALSLLRTLTEDHLSGQGIQMLPCCGFFLVADETNSSVQIVGCPNGIDWTVTHANNQIQITTDTGTIVSVKKDDYKKAVFAFADQIERFYQRCSPKILPKDEFDRNGYLAFWNEWHRRRNQL